MKPSFFSQISEISGKISLHSLLLFLVAFPLSVSASQILAGLSIFCFIFSPKENFQKIKTYLLPWGFILGAYALVFISSLYHWEEYSNFWKTFTRQSEAGDFWLSILFPIAAVHSSDENNRKLIYKYLWISFLLVLISGIASVFSEYRLGKFISNGFTPAPGDRRQHPAGPLFGLETYLPIGLMNTHLTYGGLISFYIPGLALLVLQKIKKKDFKLTLGFAVLLLLASWVFLLNQSKSAWLGVLAVTLYFILNKWRDFSGKFPRVTFTRITIAIGLLIILGGTVRFFYQKNWLLQRTLAQLTEIQTPENQRYWIYKLSLPLLAKNPILGTGGGRFKETSSEVSKSFIEKNEQLWYELYITPNKHAHNDILEFAIVGGWLSGILWIGFFYLLFRKISDSSLEDGNFPLIGIGFIWVAGFFQCYLLDDEVALPFFALAGLLWGREKETSSKFSKTSAIFLGLTFLLNTSFWIWRLSIPAELAYGRQVFASSSPLAKKIERRILPFRNQREEREKRILETISVLPSEGNSEFSIEGCLTHRYPNPAKLREEDYSFGIYISPTWKNSPTKMNVTVFSEESFDEDKLYWSHRKYDLGMKELDLKPGWNSFVWKETLGLSKITIFPDIVFFRSFKIRFGGFSPEKQMDLPVLDLGDLCDFKLK
ncbi:O-antigen ligase family protein [Leptospira andrefontaineae]|uniref:O-antigen ligase family protein n=1 Tax=Leptospira andrefontaineae TaxID=2484976 RepID=A0A4R9H2J4_9LEPT|nr:O-antigen ligase family protein [Leptospira andrefontaineae]TGK38921.1 O-antigen ligase family protein [Leptospira andrefontaineae]